MILDVNSLKEAILGGCILGGGGGGHRDHGEETGRLALEKGEINLLSIDELEDDDVVICASLVGAPSAIDRYISEEDYIYTVRKIEEEIGKPIKGIITNENGGGATVNGWIQSVNAGISLIDAPANGRAHPTGIMGSLNLHKIEDYESIQVFSGGNPETNKNVKGVVRGNLDKCAKLVRQGAVQSGGLVVVARNPITVKYLKENGAIGGVSHALDLGRKFYSALKNGENPILKVNEFLNGEVILEGKVSNLEIKTDGGFDVGYLNIGDGELTFWNEYMTLEVKGERKYSFPDLIMTFDTKTFMPVTSSEIKDGMDITVLCTELSNLKLGTPMFEQELLDEIKEVIGKNI